ncbi:ead/Ea22-like family protein [Enterobacter asburiae]
MSNIDKQALRQLATRATPGPWEEENGEVWIMRNGTASSILTSICGDDTSGQQDFDNARFIAAANPETVLALLDELGAKDRRISELESDNAYIKNRHKELDLLIGKNILVMQAAIIEWQGTGDARKGLAWVYNTLFGPGELPDEAEKDAQAYFDRKYGPLDEELMNLHRWFWEQSEAERAAAAGKGEAS